jgi:flagellar hook protein FlgE
MLMSTEGANQMGVFSAMTTAISGLNAQAYALENISGNIANSQTLGFKRNDTNFTDLVPDFGGPRQVSGSVAADKKQTISLAGDFQATSFGTDIALQGSGYFVVQKKELTSAGAVIFSDSGLYTRRGDFRTDKDSYLVNGAGYYLNGYELDLLTGAPVSGVPAAIQIPSGLLAASETDTVVYQGNLPVDPSSGTKTAVAAGGTITAANEAVFLTETISGGSVSLYNSLGNSQTLQLRWGRTAANTWDAYYLSNSTAAGAAAKWTSLGNFATFNATTGALTTVMPATISPTINGVAFPNVSFDLTGTTQFGDPSGAFRPTQITQDGYTTGSPTGVSINEFGRIFQTYSNGKSIPVADIAVANFNGDDALNRIDGGTFEETDGSGVPILGLGGASVRSSGLEASNVDIAQEFTKLITTQQAYSANTKVITTSQDLLATTINMVR